MNYPSINRNNQILQVARTNVFVINVESTSSTLVNEQLDVQQSLWNTLVAFLQSITMPAIAKGCVRSGETNTF